MFQNFLKFVPYSTIDNEVDRSIEYKSEVVEAGKTEKPVGRDELITTPGIKRKVVKEVGNRYIPDYHIYHEELKAVEDNPWNVTEKKDANNADEDGRHVDFISCLGFPCSDMAVSEDISHF